MTNPKAQDKEPITLAGARRLAANCQDRWIEVYISEKTRIVSFSGKNARINLYYGTGTVATLLNHPTRGRSQLLQTKVDMPKLKQLFGNPRLHSELGYSNLHVNERVFERMLSPTAPEIHLDEEAALREQIQSIDNEIVRLKNHRSNLEKGIQEAKVELEKMEAARRKREVPTSRKSFITDDENDHDSRTEGKDHSRGQYLTYSFGETLHKFLDNIDMDDVVCIVPLPNHISLLYTTRQGKSFWTAGGIPKEVDKALRTRSVEHCRPTIVAIGTHDRYFMQFANGKEQWEADDDEFHKAIKGRYDIKHVAFGEQPDSFFVVYNNGSCAWRNVPKQLDNYVRSRRVDLPGVDFVSLGKSGQFFVRFRNNDWRSDGLTDAKNKLIDEVEEENGDIQEIYFGAGGTIIRYD